MYQLFAYYPDQLPMSVIPQKKPTTLCNHHIKGFHDRFTQAREKWGVKCHMNFWTPCKFLSLRELPLVLHQIITNTLQI